MMKQNCGVLQTLLCLKQRGKGAKTREGGSKGMSVPLITALPMRRLNAQAKGNEIQIASAVQKGGLASRITQRPRLHKESTGSVTIQLCACIRKRS